jgi:hypothetical protein
MSRLRTQGTVLAFGLLLLVCPALSAAADDDTVIKALDGDALKELLEEEGFKGITVDKPDKDVHIVAMKFDGKRAVVICNLNSGDITGRFAIAGTNANQRKINQWNESKKFFKAHLDKDGDPVFEHILVLKYGVTRKTVKEHISLMDPGIKAFIKEVCD